MRGVLGWRPLVFLGVISYSFFLLHKTVLMVAYDYLPDTGADWVASQNLFVVGGAFAAMSLGMLVVSICFAYLSYRFVESPFLRYKPK